MYLKNQDPSDLFAALSVKRDQELEACHKQHPALCCFGVSMHAIASSYERSCEHAWRTSHWNSYCTCINAKSIK